MRAIATGHRAACASRLSSGEQGKPTACSQAVDAGASRRRPLSHSSRRSEVLNPDGTPHETNTRAPLAALINDKVRAEAPLFGFEQGETPFGGGHAASTRWPSLRTGRVWAWRLAMALLTPSTRAHMAAHGRGRTWPHPPLHPSSLYPGPWAAAPHRSPTPTPTP
jgi:hypothetical protein